MTDDENRAGEDPAPPQVFLSTPEETAPPQVPSSKSEAPAPVPMQASTLVIPTGTLPLLDAQLAEGLKIMDTFARWIAHPNSAIQDCVYVSDSVSKLAHASAELAKVAARLHQGMPESRHRVIVEYTDDSREGEGVVKTRKRIKRHAS